MTAGPDRAEVRRTEFIPLKRTDFRFTKEPRSCSWIGARGLIQRDGARSDFDC